MTDGSARRSAAAVWGRVKVPPLHSGLAKQSGFVFLSLPLVKNSVVYTGHQTYRSGFTSFGSCDMSTGPGLDSLVDCMSLDYRL
ncbi:hypothetical protein NL676_022053 [Syzygium grande]|nr:hypothetical protein NL676_022053 [Syzygium grande]